VTATLAGLSWPLSRLDEAIELLARRLGHSAVTPGATAALGRAAAVDSPSIGRALDRLLFAHGLEPEPCEVRYADAAHLPVPVILRVAAESGETEPAFLVVAARRRNTMAVLGIDRRWHRLSHSQIAAALRAPLDASQAAEVDRLLAAASINEPRRDRVRRALLAEQLADSLLTDGWRVVAEPGGDFAHQLRRAGVTGQAGALFALHATQFALWIAAWWLAGSGALQGRTDWGWLTAWALLVATIVPLQLLTTWMQGSLALRTGRLLKERLLVGALRLDPEDIRHQGAGQLLGRVLESDAVESLAISGGLQAGLAAVEIVMAAGVLWFGAAGGVQVGALAGWTLAAAAAAAAYYRHRRRWSESRLDMTNDLVERVAGHRTRLALESPHRWHEEEDRSLEAYLVRSSALDRWLPTLLVVVPRVWIATALGLLVPAFVAGTSAEQLAVSLGGVLLAAVALRRFADGLSQLAGAAIAWKQARPLFVAAVDRPSAPAIADDPAAGRVAGAAALDVRDVSFRYPSRAEAVLHGCTLRAASGERLLLQGRSGGGKSTFASIVAGLREPNSGLVLVDGLDRRTLGAEGWRRRVIAVPQFHENHVFSETFAFNLLMGRQWPPTDADLEAAGDVVDQLGLGHLVGRMPAGLLQLVGEGGWQLSHGERSRLYMARALLQGGEVMVLDESFAALDPENLRETLESVLRRAPTLMVIAHP
jgi:ATP-binding cassette subfamily B protein